MLRKFRLIAPITFFLYSFYPANPALAKDQEGANSSEDRQYALDDSLNEIDQKSEEMARASSRTVRRFHEVLDELLAEFGYDVKTGQIKGLKNLAIRKVEVSDAIPSTYRKYVELLISERIKENSKIRLISCVPCKSKTSRMVEGKIIVTSPSTNIGELKATAEKLNIDNFMDIILVYHATHMVLAMQIFRSDSNELMYSRTYNSETIRSRYQKLAIDYSQVAKSRPGENYQPEYRLMLGLGGAAIPNISGGKLDNTMLDLHFRSTEKFDRRRSEFGMLLSTFVTLSSVLNEYPKVEGTGTTSTDDTSTDPDTSDFELPPQPKPFSFALAIYGLYTYNFLGVVESYNQIRQGVHLGIGSILTSGYLAPISKLGLDVYFGKRFVFTISGVYIGGSQITLDSTIVETTGGAGGEAILSFNF